jgi:hypothetical protein
MCSIVTHKPRRRSRGAEAANENDGRSGGCKKYNMEEIEPVPLDVLRFIFRCAEGAYENEGHKAYVRPEIIRYIIAKVVNFNSQQILF